MRTLFQANKCSLFRAVSLIAVVLASPGARAAFVYETPTEFLTSGDFNGDGAADVLVLDKLTGNARVGYGSTNGSLTWSAALTTSVENVTGCAPGHFVSGTRDVLAVASEALNRVNLFDLSNTNSSALVTSSQASGLGPHSLAGLAAPFFSPPPPNAALLIASTLNDAPPCRLDIVTNYPIGPATSAGQFAEAGSFERPNALSINTNGPTFATGLVRGSNDTFHVWQFTNSPSVILSFGNLPAGSDYAFGNFNGESLPRFIFYQRGGTNLTIASLLQTNTGVIFGPSFSVTLTQAVLQVFYQTFGANGSAVVNFGDGVRSLSLAGGVPKFTPKYQAGLGAAGNVFTGVVPMANGQMALLDAPAGNPISVHSQILTFDGTNFTQRSAANLPAVSSRTTRANVWLFQLQPFVNASPGFIESLNSPDWADAVNGLTNSVQVVAEADAGVTNGLGSLSTNNLGAPPSGAVFAIENQYHPAISLFTYSAPQAPDSVHVNISPPPGAYASPLTITLTGNGAISYRVSPGGLWQTYAASFIITNDATIQYFGTTLLSQRRSRIQFASYDLGRPPNGLAPAPAGLDPGNTNPPPVLGTNQLILSENGTVFYGRRSAINTGTIWAINLDGSGETFITTGFRPRASKDGHYLAFLRDGNPSITQGNVWLRDLLTGQERILFNNTNYTIGYDWDRTGTNLLFDESCGLWKISPGGTASLLPLMTDCYDDAPVVNPVDGRLAFHNLNSNSAISGLYVTSPDLATKTRLNLSTGVVGASWPAWSSDAQWLVLADGNSAGSSFTADGGTNLWVVHPDGTDLNQITAFADGTNRFPHGALWSPDGNALVGVGTIFGTNGLWIIPLTPEHDDCDGAPILLPTKPGDAIDFAGSIVVAAATQTNFVPQPGLFIRRDPGAIVVFWSTNFAGFTLESVTNLASTVWSPINGPYDFTAYFYEHREAESNLLSASLFRLRYNSGSFKSNNSPTTAGSTNSALLQPAQGRGPRVSNSNGLIDANSPGGSHFFSR